MNVQGFELKAFVRTDVLEEYKAAVLQYENDPEVGWITYGSNPSQTREGGAVDRAAFYSWDIENRTKPHVTFWESAVKSGYLAGLAVDVGAEGLQVGEMTAKILKGEKAANISVEEPLELNIVVNKKRAKTLAVEIPDKIKKSAYRIYTDYKGYYVE